MSDAPKEPEPPEAKSEKQAPAPKRFVFKDWASI